MPGTKTGEVYFCLSIIVSSIPSVNLIFPTAVSVCFQNCLVEVLMSPPTPFQMNVY